jgi:hypothetical protein
MTPDTQLSSVAKPGMPNGHRNENRSVASLIGHEYENEMVTTTRTNPAVLSQRDYVGA